MVTQISKSKILTIDQLERLLFTVEQMHCPSTPSKEWTLLGQLVANKHHQWMHFFSERQCVPGEVIFWEYEPGDSMYIIQSGRAVVIKGDIPRPVILDCHSEGESIGEMALLEGSQRSASVIALESVNLLEINRENFFKLLSTSITFSQGIMRLLSTRLRDTSDAVQRETMEKTRDPLTGLHNRHYIFNVLKHELQRAERAQYPVCVIMMDLDHFKEVNDTYGHLAGDQVLRSLGGLIRSQIRRADVACRYGGEEFLIIFPETSVDTALTRADAIRSDFEELCIEYDGQLLHRTLSMGLAVFPDHGRTPEKIVRAADAALYQAKASGRNKVVATGKTP